MVGADSVLEAYTTGEAVPSAAVRATAPDEKAVNAERAIDISFFFNVFFS